MLFLYRVIPRILEGQWFAPFGGSGGVGDGFTVLDSDGNPFNVSNTVLDADGNAFVTSDIVLDADGNPFDVI